MIGYIYKTINNITKEFYIGKREYQKDAYQTDEYLGSSISVKESINRYGIENFSKIHLCECNSLEELSQKEKYYIEKYVEDPLCLNHKKGIGYGGSYIKGRCKQCGKHTTIYSNSGLCMSCIIGTYEKYYCEKCKQDTHHYKSGKCMKCASKEAHTHKFCNFCQKETTWFGTQCKSHTLHLVKNNGKIELHLKKGGQDFTLFDDISFIENIKRITTERSELFKLPKDALHIKCNNEFVDLKSVLYNKDVSNWLKITYKYDSRYDHERSIILTEDHPLPVIDGTVKRADQLVIGDKLIRINPHISGDFKQWTYAEIINIEPYDYTGKSYDVETETEYFDINEDILSHNCRASLSPWYERGGMEPADENDVPIFEGRFNLGAISLHLPMILQKSRQEDKDFYEVLDYYLELIRNLHKKTYAFLGEKKASTNPLGFCQGGFYGGHLDPDDNISSILPPMTMSFGITALNELQVLYNGKSITEDGEFALEVMQYINDYVNKIKKEDNILYAIYGTPAESIAGLQVEQFRKKYGIIKGVSDKPYVSNSFHCAVWEDITPIEKQDKEERFWHLFNGGKIQYCKYPIDYNFEAIKTLVRRAMDKGFYEGVNLSLSYCEDCGYEQLSMDICPKCGSENICKIERMNGYLGYTKVHGKPRYNDAKLAEIKDRISM